MKKVSYSIATLGILVLGIFFCFFVLNNKNVSAEIITFKRVLKLGSTGTDVKQLQIFLNSDPATVVAVKGVGSSGHESTYYGSATAKAVSKFQLKYKNEILTPNKISTPTGILGFASIKKINTLQLSKISTSSVTAIATTSQIQKPVVVKLTQANDVSVEQLPTQYVTAGQNISFSLKPTASAKNAHYALSSPITGATFDSNTNIFSWTPQDSQVGTAAISFEAYDTNNALLGRQSVVINVLSRQAIVLPTITSSPTTQLPQKFAISDFNGNGTQEGTGFSINDASVTSASGQTNDAIKLVKKSEQQTSADTIVQQWASANNEVSVVATLKKQNSDLQMDVAVTSGQGWTVNKVSIGAPWVFASTTSTLKTYGAFKGGMVMNWSQTGYEQQNSSSWPSMGYSPIAVFYDSATGEGVGFVAFDGGLKQRQVFWVTGPGRVDPNVNWFVGLTPNSSASISLYLHHDFGMPENHFAFYRQHYLIPFMQSLGINEGRFSISGVLSSSGWPLNNDVSAEVKKFVALGASGHIQWAPPDGIDYYEPNPETLSWFPTLKAASTVPGSSVLGVLINPFFKSRQTPPTTDPTDPTWFPGPRGEMSLKDQNVQNWLGRLRADLVSQGVNFAFWDTGTSPKFGEEQEWVNLLKTWKQAGITIAAESSCDINAYITGSTMLVGWDADPHHLAKVVTPQAGITFLGSPGYTPVYTGTAPYWWDDVLAKGFIPVLNDPEMAQYAKEHNLSVSMFDMVTKSLAAVMTAISNIILRIFGINI